MKFLNESARREDPEYWKELFEMKQDDWIDACGEIDVLKEQNKIMRETLKKISEFKSMLIYPGGQTNLHRVKRMASTCLHRLTTDHSIEIISKK